MDQETIRISELPLETELSDSVALGLNQNGNTVRLNLNGIIEATRQCQDQINGIADEIGQVELSELDTQVTVIPTNQKNRLLKVMDNGRCVGWLFQTMYAISHTVYGYGQTFISPMILSEGAFTGHTYGAIFVYHRMYNPNTSEIADIPAHRWSPWREVAGSGILNKIDSLTTPSGDPMHELYLRIGARYSTSTGKWSLNQLTDLTCENMRDIVLAGKAMAVRGCYAAAPIRTNYTYNGNINFGSGAADSYFNDCPNLEVANCMNFLTSPSIRYMFYNCPQLQRVQGVIDVSGAADASAYSKAFDGCQSLQRVLLKGVKHNISFKDSPNLSDESLEYLVENAANTEEITVSLYASRYFSLPQRLKYSAQVRQIAFAAAPLDEPILPSN